MADAVLNWVLASALMLPSVAMENPQNADPVADLNAKANLILDRSDVLARIWPGFWPNEQGFVLYDPSHGAVLIGAEGRPRSVTYRAGELPGANRTFALDYPAGTPNMMMVQMGDNWRTTATTLFHEQFHDFQRDAFDKTDWKHGGEYIDLTAISDRAAFTAAAELERRVLADAILAETAAQSADLTRQYIALRRIRERTVEETVVGKERYFERLEGTAQYIGLKASSIVLGDDADSVAGALAGGLRRSLFANGEGSYSGNWFRTRAYDVGGALALLLDRSGADWKARIEAGEPLDAVLESILGAMDISEQERVAAAARINYGADQILADTISALAVAPKTIESIADFMQLGSRHLVLKITLPRERLGEGQQFSSTKEMIAIGRSATAFLNVIDFQLEKPGIKLGVQGLSIMTEMLPVVPDEPATMIYTVSLGEDVTLPEIDQLARGDHMMNAIDLSVPGLTLSIDTHVNVTVAENLVTLATSLTD